MIGKFFQGAFKKYGIGGGTAPVSGSQTGGGWLGKLKKKKPLVIRGMTTGARPVRY